VENRILIANGTITFDTEINKGVLTVIKGLNINNVQQVQYCDDANLKIKKAALENSPYDLLITDLSFVQDHRKQKYP
jgi:hypothetical protein